MFLKKYMRGILGTLFFGLILMHAVESNASSAPVLPYAAYVVPVTLATLCVASFGWSWWTADKVSHIDERLELVATDVKDVQVKVQGVDVRVQNVQKVQGEHTAGLNALGEGQKLIRGDISKLNDTTEVGIKTLSDKQDRMRGAIEDRFDQQAKELKTIKAAVEQLRGSTSSTPLSNKHINHSSAPYTYTPVFDAAAK